MTRTVGKLAGALQTMGSDIVFHRESGGAACPCRTPEGFRDPAWHQAHVGAPLCNEQGLLAAEVLEFTFKGSVQPALTASRRPAQRADDLLGEVQRDDKVAIFPCTWEGRQIDLSAWSDAGEDYVVYDGFRYTIVAADKLADVDGDPSHHWECGLRLMTGERP